jgi:arginine N-succinyltransferase
MTDRFRYVIRDSRPDDLEVIESLAEMLNTMNLPRDRRVLKHMLEKSERSFLGRIPDPAEAEYVFVLEDLERRRAIGTSLIIAKHGTLSSPHYFMKVETEKRQSDVPPREIHHRVLKLGYTHDGPTEIGGLILHPDYRRAPEQLGMQLSYVRFNFIGRHPEQFQKQVLAELLSPLDAEGKNRFWEVYGRKFTGLEYREADRLSMTDKKFIDSLFPEEPLYTAVLPEEVQRSLGQVAPGARGAERLLRKIGLRPLGEIDPFDGGPFFGAGMKDVTLLRDTVTREARPDDAPGGTATLAIVSHQGDQGFRALCTPVRIDNREVAMPSEACARLDAYRGAPLTVTPVP